MVICKKFDIYGLNHRFLRNVFLIVSYYIDFLDCFSLSTFKHLDIILLLGEPFADNMYGKLKVFSYVRTIFKVPQNQYNILATKNCVSKLFCLNGVRMPSLQHLFVDDTGQPSRQKNLGSQ